MTLEEYWNGLAPEPEDEDNRIPVIEAVSPIAMTVEQILADQADTCPF